MLSLKKRMLVALVAVALVAAAAGAIPSQPLATGVIVHRLIGSGIIQH
jgi:hypothetical protein